MALSMWLLGAAVSCLCLPRPAAADWQPNGTAVDTQVGEHHEPHLVPDGSGGVYVVWTHVDGVRRLRAQHLTVAGEPATGWSAGGLEIAPDANARTLLGTGPDGGTGLLVGWLEGGAGRAVRLLSDGSVAGGWDPTGTAFLTPADPSTVINYFAADHAGGAWFAVQSNSQFCPDICYNSSAEWLNHLTGPSSIDGTWLLVDSPYLYGAILEDRSTRPGSLIASGVGGSGFSGNWMRLAPGVGPLWTVPLGVQDLFVHGSADDGAGGGLLVTEGGYGTAAPHVLRRDASGANPAGWPAEGVPIRVPAAAYMAGIVAVDDATGGVLIGWIEAGGAGNELRVQRMTHAGAPAAGWPADGVLIDDAPGAHDGLRIAPDGAGGVYAAWADRRSDASGDVYATHVRANGSLDPLFAINGSPVAVAAGVQDNIDLVAVPPGYCLVAWEDARDPAHSVIYAQRIPEGVTLDVRPPQPQRFALLGFCPNPARGPIRVGFRLAEQADATLEVFDLLGRRVAGQEFAALPAGEHSVPLDGPGSLPNGVYLIRVRAGDQERTARGLIAR